MKDDIIAKISEIFTSVQGEGPYLGSRQTFIRFYGCNLSCRFCDTENYHFLQYSTSEILEEIMSKPHCDFLSITGGEPLLQVIFLQELLPRLKKESFKIYLETNGTKTDELISVIDFINIISMDFKLPSSTGQKSYFREHEQFLKAARKKEVFVKAVITDSTLISDLKTAVEIIKGVDRGILFVLQPDTNQLSHNLFQKIETYRAFACEHLENVRIIPQVHRLVGLR
ncbi:MAG: 7-carboxy-7-deazaguanine synthase QueE [Candidatus Omnitrophica bacterium]|nr:7-carboxy-7-deazaguanine synthase QueE [Candidatus Omnitrophota bacterium]